MSFSLTSPTSSSNFSPPISRILLYSFYTRSEVTSFEKKKIIIYLWDQSTTISATSFLKSTKLIGNTWQHGRIMTRFTPSQIEKKKKKSNGHKSIKVGWRLEKKRVTNSCGWLIEKIHRNKKAKSKSQQ